MRKLEVLHDCVLSARGHEGARVAARAGLPQERAREPEHLLVRPQHVLCPGSRKRLVRLYQHLCVAVGALEGAAFARHTCLRSGRC
jgi:hypothetical protein